MLVSVIVPCYNVEHFISTCIDSVIRQTHPELEIICVDNNSTDRTKKVLDDLVSAWPDKIKVTSCLIQGAPAARNIGVNMAQGEWLQFLDADDLLMPEKIAHQLEIVSRSPNPADIILGAYEKKFVNGTSRIIDVESQNIWKGLINARAGCTCSNLYRKTAVKEAGGWDETKKSSQEAYLLFHLLKNHSVPLFDDRPLTVINERGSGSISSDSKSQNWERYILLRTEVLTYLEKTHPDNSNAILAARQAIFDSIRILYKMNSQKALTLYNLHIRNKFKPVPSQATGKHYITLFNMFGFPLSEKVAGVLKKILR